ncbi:hypothetical protein SLEP1_g25239 [Rubroshorea leprosula]|uniref:Uncharacterized protein n=1 Tax=Rubroshorea leprosula TaxID=152421 RepID=A0AAV5JSQ6_9ROSI|nr:hypothetical protein SLEP1_g25239 [Rubroshorea leprosula]
MKQTPLLEKHQRRLGFDHGEYFPPRGRAGRLALWWTKELQVQEIGFKGNPYTWTNSRLGPANVQHRLDKALENLDWFRCYPHAQVLHELKIGSDHSPLILCSNAFPNSSEVVSF